LLRTSLTMRRAPAFVLLVLLLTFSVFGTAQADTPAITDAQRDAQALRSLIDELNDELSKLDEDYNYANQRLQETQALIKKTTSELAEAQKDLEAAQQQFSERLVGIYKEGRAGALSVLLSADDFSDLVNRFQQLKRVGRQDSELLAQVKTYSARVADRQSDLTAQLRDEEVHAAETAEAKQKVEDQLALQKELLKGKEAQVAQLQREEAARQAKLAAAAKAAAAKAAAEEAAKLREAAASAAAQSPDGSGGSTSSGKTGSFGTTVTTAGKSGGSSGGSSDSASSSDSGGSSDNGSNNGGAADGTSTEVPSSPTGTSVVSIAMQYLGVPYVWAGSSPSGFDCSGLVKYVYAKVGISLPHSSRMMYDYGTPVSRDQLEPGDLVFFYDPIHHVGIYIGDGRMINARGSQVQIDDLWTKSYHGARRIL